MKLRHILPFLFLARLSFGQEVLNLETAIDLAVANNPSVKIQQQQISITKNSVSKSNTGQVLTLDAVGLASYTNNFADLKIRTFQPEPAPSDVALSEFGVQTFTANVGLEAKYVLWDGGAGAYRYQLLDGLSEIEAAKQVLIINGIIKGTVELYLEMLKVQNQIEVLNENNAVTRSRIAKLNDKREFSKVNDLAVLQAETNLNQDLSTVDKLGLLYKNLETDLKTLMNDISDKSYSVRYPGETSFVPDEANLRTLIQASNPEILLLKKGINLSEIELELEKANFKPTVATFGNAGYFGQRNDLQQLAQIQTVGATVGVRASYRIFDGGSREIKIQNAKIAQLIEADKLDKRTGELVMEARKQLQNIAFLETQLAREEKNAETYQLNYDKTVDRFNLGQLPEITLREAQLALINSKITIANYRVDLEKAARLLGLIVGK